MSAQVEKWLDHIRALAVDIGPRGPTTEGERLGAAYCTNTLRRLGLDRPGGRLQQRPLDLPAAPVDRRCAATGFRHLSAGRPRQRRAHGAHLAGRASPPTCWSSASSITRSAGSWPRSRQNVVATVAPAAEHRQDLVLIGHIDTQRTPIVFSTHAGSPTYKAFTTVAFVLFAAQTVLYLVGTVTGWPWIWPLTGLSAVGALLLMAMCIQADRTPFTAGANDNASAVGLVLTLAERSAANRCAIRASGWRAPAARRCGATAPSISSGGTVVSSNNPA